ncbi:MAG: septum formation initiator family protein [Intestinimonas sp.]|nr:septum formation initiator family protein [Intestinimonas sp.]
MVKTKKAGILTKLVILALLIYLATTLLNLHGQISRAQTQLDALNQQVAQQTQRNAALTDDVTNSGDPDRITEIARDKLGLIEPGEKVFIIAH